MTLEIRPVTVGDAPLVHEAVVESLEHLRPWMPWAATEPITIEERAERITSWTEAYGIFDGDRYVGMVGIHDRLGNRAGREIGYWVRVSEAGRGFATEATRRAVDVAFAMPGVHYVEIHHDKANARSRRVPEKLGFTLVREVPDAVEAPGEVGISCEWRLDKR